jgi:energy-coupling factor transporter ATP-binding protein EcfA2
LDFFKIRQREGKNKSVEVYPDFVVGKSKDLMVKAKDFFAIWDEETGLWSTDEYDVQRLTDKELMEYGDRISPNIDGQLYVKLMTNYSTGVWSTFRSYITHIPDNAKPLDSTMTFLDQKTTKKDYASKRLPYSLEDGPCDAYDELISTLYTPEERQKLEWSMGAVLTGESRDIQKFVVLYGTAGSGKSTVLNIMQMLFEGYYSMFEAKALGSNNNAFATETFKSNPLVAIQHDGDLSKIEDNSKINSVTSHEEMTINEKFKPSYTSKIDSFLYMGTNKPVKITDAKSGIIRRLIDVHPSGNKIPLKHYTALMSQISFELGAIAQHNINVYRELGKGYYAGYRPLEMMQQTNVFFNFVEDNYDTFNAAGGISLDQAWTMYKVYCDETLLEYKIPRYKFREELKNYFHTFQERTTIDERRVRNWYSDFMTEKFESNVDKAVEHPIPLVLDKDVSLFDSAFANYPAQYANSHGTPNTKWDDVETVLSELDTHKIHYVKPPFNQIVIDFDLKNEKGEKDAERNLEAASKWPPTYAEYSKGGKGVHLHYIYDGDVSKLRNLYAEDIEVKVFTGKASLRRKLSKCNDIPIAHISSGLPLKEEKVINFEGVKSERALRNLIQRNLNKEIHPGTKPSIDFICKILDDAYESDLRYDVRDMEPKITNFALSSSHWPDYCIKVTANMKFRSKEDPEGVPSPASDPIVFFDCEVFPNLFLINWKVEGEDQTCVRMVNPTPSEVGELLKRKLVGFNCRRYDNHILYARYIGYTNEELYALSQKIVNGNRNVMFADAYNLSYTDVYDFSAKKQSLKKFEIELGIHHQELGLPWDQPVDESLWAKVAEYCDNDVIATEAVFNARKDDFIARQVLADLSGLSVNASTNSHSAKIIFGADREPQNKFWYTDLATGHIYKGGEQVGRS